MHFDEAGLKAEFSFERQARTGWNDFWRRIGGVPDLKGKRVLDFGCNRGGSVHRALQEGAASVTGIDVSEAATVFARERLQPQWGERVEILCGNLADMDLDPFDIVFSVNTMEHVENPAKALDAIVSVCKPGAEMFFGFSPLWYSPYGHHHYPQTKVPWLHVLRGDRIVLDALEAHTGSRPASVKEAGFNCATPRDFRNALKAQPVQVISSRRNVGRTAMRTRISQALLPLGIIPALEKYVTVGMFWHLRKLPGNKEVTS